MYIFTRHSCYFLPTQPDDLQVGSVPVQLLGKPCVHLQTVYPPCDIAEMECTLKQLPPTCLFYVIVSMYTLA